MSIRFPILLIVLSLAACGNDDAGSNRIVGQLASDRVELTADFSEPVIERPVAEGQFVSAGTLLLAQDTARIEARVAEARAAVGERGARLDELTRGPRQEQIAAVRANLAGARDDIEFRRVEYRRARDVYERQLAAAESVDRAKAALDAAQAQFDVYEAQLSELLAGTTVEELAQAEQRLLQAQASLRLLETDLARHRLTAPQDGIVDSLLIEVGERPQPAQPLVVMLTGAQPYARVYVPEEQRIHVRPGMVARVHVDGLDDIIDARVRWVASDAAFTPYFALTQHDRGRLTYAAKVDLDYEGTRLPDGVPVEVELDLPAASDGRD